MEVSGPDVRYLGEGLLTQLFFYLKFRHSHVLHFMEHIIKWTKFFEKGDLMPKEPVAPGLCPITHKEFNEFMKGKGFKGRNNYKLTDLKTMFGFKPMITGSPVMISSNQLEPMRFDSMSKASTSTRIPYVTLLYAKKNSRH